MKNKLSVEYNYIGFGLKNRKEGCGTREVKSFTKEESRSTSPINITSVQTEEKENVKIRLGSRLKLPTVILYRSEPYTSVPRSLKDGTGGRVRYGSCKEWVL